MFDAHAKRMAVQRVIELKNAMISGVWANSNNDEGENIRTGLLTKIDEFAENSIAGIYGHMSQSEQEYLDDMNSPFIKAMKVPKIDSKISSEELGEI